MSFTTDKQTLDDLGLNGRFDPHSIYNLFNKVQTAGGEKLLEAHFRQPLDDAREINRRSRVFAYFEQTAPAFPFTRQQLVVMEDYLTGSSGHWVQAAVSAARKRLAAALVRDEAWGVLQLGVTTVIAVLHGLADLLHRLEDIRPDGPYQDQLARLQDILKDPRLRLPPGERPREGRPAGGVRLTLGSIIRYDHLFRQVLRERLQQVTEGIYQLDVNMAVGKVARAKGFSYAQALPKERAVLGVVDLRHPGIAKAVANSLTLHRESNMLFLTGANMAGKSTFMKAFGIAVYLAHMGFPVAATEMTFSVLDGLYTSINVPDNLSLGYSHFYAEVLRVKKVAEAVASGKNLLVIFDELFKGTNVKDAYDATLAVTEAFSKYRNCYFIISTHIIEAGEALREKCGNLLFAYLPTVMEGMTARYTYRLETGITSDRHGMLIIENERILDIIQA
jgi:DNA mismatch repair protein MutS